MVTHQIYFESRLLDLLMQYQAVQVDSLYLRDESMRDLFHLEKK